MRTIEDIEQRESGLPKVFGKHQLAMVAIGVIFSFGMLSGASYPLNLAGPRAVLSYLAASIVVALVIRCLSVMTARNPTPGAFGSYAESYLGPASGYMVRSAYIIGLVFIIGTEAELFGRAIARPLFGTSGAWISALGLAAIIFVNLLHAKWFARLEFILSSIKIAALLLFVVLAWTSIIKGGHTTTLANHAMEYQWTDVYDGALEAFVLAVLGYAGTESLAIAAGETKSSKTDLKRILHVITGVIIFMVMATVLTSSALMLIGVLPITTLPSIFVFQLNGLPPQLFHVIIAITVLSVLNSQVYSASRMLFSLGRSERRLSWLGLIHGNSPRIAVMAVAAISFSVYALLQAYPYHTFIATTTIASSCLLAVWVMIFFTFLGFVKKTRPDPAVNHDLRTWPSWVGVGIMTLTILLIWKLTLFELTLKIGVPFIIILWFTHLALLQKKQ